MMDQFVFPGLTTRVVFGAGTLSRAQEEVRRLGHDKVLVLSTPHQKADAEKLAESLGGLASGIFAGATMHTPVEVTETAVEAFRASGATAVVSLGGGSTTGLGKAIAVRTGADQVVIPTTYAGSEMTDILGETAAGEKTTRRSPDIRPETVIYDVDLTLSLPVNLTVTSAMNAIAHAMEAFYAPDRNPVIELMCRDAMVAFRDGIPRLIEDPQDRRPGPGALCGLVLLDRARLCLDGAAPQAGACLRRLVRHAACRDPRHPAALHHRLQRTGGARSAASDRGCLRRWLGRRRALGFRAVRRLAVSLKAIGIEESDLDRATAIAVKNAYTNPRPIDPGSIRELLQAAFEGRRPGG
jgi:maleylacetate reductase